jgi:hypothetical protein
VKSCRVTGELNWRLRLAAETARQAPLGTIKSDEIG